MEIAGYEGLYYIERNGDVYSQDRIVKDKNGISYFRKGRLIKPKNNGKGYYNVCLCKNNEMKYCYIHRLVAMTYLPNPNNFPCVNHKDCNRKNNNLNNLEWCTYEYNSQSLNTKRNFGCVNFRKDREKCYEATYILNKLRHSKCFKTEEEAKDWLKEQKLYIQKNNLINN